LRKKILSLVDTLDTTTSAVSYRGPNLAESDHPNSEGPMPNRTEFELALAIPKNWGSKIFFSKKYVTHPLCLREMVEASVPERTNRSAHFIVYSQVTLVSLTSIFSHFYALLLLIPGLSRDLKEQESRKTQNTKFRLNNLQCNMQDLLICNLCNAKK
jgi:hypothetical protein